MVTHVSPTQVWDITSGREKGLHQEIDQRVEVRVGEAVTKLVEQYGRLRIEPPPEERKEERARGSRFTTLLEQPNPKDQHPQTGYVLTPDVNIPDYITITDAKGNPIQIPLALFDAIRNAQTGGKLTTNPDPDYVTETEKCAQLSTRSNYTPQCIVCDETDHFLNNECEHLKELVSNGNVQIKNDRIHWPDGINNGETIKPNYRCRGILQTVLTSKDIRQ